VHASRKQLLLRRAELFAGIKGSGLSEILDAAETRRIGTRHVILREGTTAAHLFLLKSGRAKFYRVSHSGDEVLLTALFPGDTFGLGTLLSGPAPYMGSAETTRNSELLMWKHARIRSLAQKYPRLAQNALGIVLRYLNAHFDRLFDLVVSSAAERLASALLHFCKETGRVVTTGVEIDITNEELAAQANVSPFTVSRLLRRWASAGALRKSRGKVFIKAPEKLLRR
jgi:CRP-like cAMP-binding protein